MIIIDAQRSANSIPDRREADMTLKPFAMRLEEQGREMM